MSSHCAKAGRSFLFASGARREAAFAAAAVAAPERVLLLATLLWLPPKRRPWPWEPTSFGRSVAEGKRQRGSVGVALRPGGGTT